MSFIVPHYPTWKTENREPFILEINSIDLSFWISYHPTMPQWFVQRNIYTNPHKFFLVRRPWSRICRQKVPHTISNISSGFFLTSYLKEDPIPIARRENGWSWYYLLPSPCYCLNLVGLSPMPIIKFLEMGILHCVCYTCWQALYGVHIGLLSLCQDMPTVTCLTNTLTDNSSWGKVVTHWIL